ncbi:hypothetical protein [Dysgonomonas sp.]
MDKLGRYTQEPWPIPLQMRAEGSLRNTPVGDSTGIWQHICLRIYTSKQIIIIRLPGKLFTVKLSACILTWIGNGIINQKNKLIIQ